MSEYVQIRPDQQWPRYEVFKQDKDGKAHQAVGSVHAADPEHALLNARNIFVRRPSAVSLWVARADHILSRTAEELAADPGWLAAPDEEGELAEYALFRKESQRRSMTFVAHIGDVAAHSAREALRLGIEKFPADEVWVWWVVPLSALHRTDEEDVPSWFEPAVDKKYRNQSSYGFVSSRRQGRKQTG